MVNHGPDPARQRRDGRTRVAGSHAAQSLAHPARLRVLCRLVEGEAPVPELQALTGLSASALSQHLAVLRGLDIVATRREAQAIHYRVLEGPALGVLQALHAAYCGAASR